MFVLYCSIEDWPNHLEKNIYCSHDRKILEDKLEDLKKELDEYHFSFGEWCKTIPNQDREKCPTYTGVLPREEMNGTCSLVIEEVEELT